MRHNVTTPGGFFVGLGGIVAFCVVGAFAYSWVSKPAASDELKAQQEMLGLVAKDSEKAKQADIKKELEAAGKAWNGGKKPDINKLDDFRGVIRYREAQKSDKDALALLNASSNVAGKSVLEAAIAEVAKDIAAKKPAETKVAVDIQVPAPGTPVSLPNVSGGGANTVQFPAPKTSNPAETK